MTSQPTNVRPEDAGLHSGGPDENEGFEGGLNLSEILNIWWRSRARIVLLALTGLVAAAAVLLAVYILRPSYQEASLTLRLLFTGVEKGQYPDGTEFTPADLVATPVLEKVYERNGLARYLPFDRFKSALAVINNNPELDRLRRSYADRFDDRRLTQIERSRIENEFNTKIKALQNGEFTLVARFGGRFSSWPLALSGKVINDVLAIWAEQSHAHGVLQFDVNVISGNLLVDLQRYDEDRFIFVDRLRIMVQRLLDNVTALQKLPGARLLRVGEKQVSLGEIQTALIDILRFNIGTLQWTIFRNGLYSNRALVESFTADQLFQLDLQERQNLGQIKSLRDAMASYSRSRDDSHSGNPAAPASNDASNPRTGWSFFDQVLDLPNQESDLTFRQGLSNESVELGLRLTEIKKQREIYIKMMAATSESTARDTPQRQILSKWTDEQIPVLLDQLKDTLSDLQLFHQELSQRIMQPSMVYTVVAPLHQERISEVKMSSAILAVAFLWIAGLGLSLGIIAWRGSVSVNR
jgi:hypothetical protein